MQCSVIQITNINVMSLLYVYKGEKGSLGFWKLKLWVLSERPWGVKFKCKLFYVAPQDFVFVS